MNKTKKSLIIILFSLFIITSFAATNKAQATNKFFYEALNAPQLTVINFHHFGKEGTYSQIENIRTSPEQFRAILQALKDKGYSTITQAQAINYLKGWGRIPQKSVLLTIDDGFVSTYQYAYPILKEMGMKATLYPIISEVELGNRLGVTTVNWTQIKEMANSRVLEMGNHTYDLHWRNSAGTEAMILGYTKNGQALTPAARKQWIKDDLLKAEATFKAQTGITMGKTLSYPYGAYDQVAVSAAKELGYQAAYTVKNGYNAFGSGADNMLQINRIGIASKTSPAQLITRLNTYTAQARAVWDKRELRISTAYDVANNKLRVLAWSSKGYQNVKHVQFEVYRNQGGQRTLVGPATVHRVTVNAKAPSATFTEDFTKVPAYQKYGKGSYSMKIILTNTKGQRFIEWINYTYK